MTPATSFSLLIWLEDRRPMSYDYLFYVSMWLKIPALKTKKAQPDRLGLEVYSTSTEMVLSSGSRSINLFSGSIPALAGSPFTRIVKELSPGLILYFCM